MMLSMLSKMVVEVQDPIEIEKVPCRGAGSSNTLVPKVSPRTCYNSNDNSPTFWDRPGPPPLGTGNKPVVDPTKAIAPNW